MRQNETCEMKDTTAGWTSPENSPRAFATYISQSELAPAKCDFMIIVISDRQYLKVIELFEGVLLEVK